jgi:hypothetical protein
MTENSAAPARKPQVAHLRGAGRRAALALIEKRFNAADAGHDGTLTAKELRSKPGRALLKLLE